MTALLLAWLAWLGLGLAPDLPRPAAPWVGAAQPTPPLVAGEPFRVLADYVVRYFDTTVAPPVPCATPPPAACVPDATELRLRIDGALVATQAVTVSGTATFPVAAGLPAGTHAVVVEAAGGGGTAASAPVSLTVDPGTPQPPPGPGPQGAPTVARQALPPPVVWNSQDIGAVGAVGTTIPTADGFTVEGSGADIWGQVDAFRFMHRPLPGDGDRAGGERREHEFVGEGGRDDSELAGRQRRTRLHARVGGE
jgi:hypothetical protein